MGRIARGVRGVTLRQEGDAVVGVEAVNGDETVLTICENGYGKRSRVEDFRQTKRGGVGVRAIVINDRNGPVVGTLCVNDSDGMVLMSSQGQALRVRMSDLRVMGRATQGVRVVQLREGDSVVAMQKLETVEEDEAVDAESGEMPEQQESRGGEGEEQPENPQGE